MTKAMTNAERLKAYRLAAVAKGLCYCCRCRPVREGARYCDDCILKGQAQEKRMADRRRAAQKCPKCGLDPFPGLVHCEACLDAYSESRASRVARGKCQWCGIVDSSGAVGCAACTEKQRLRARNRSRVRAGDRAVKVYRCSECGSADHNRRIHDRAEGVRP